MISSTQTTPSFFVVLGGDNPRIFNSPPTIDKNALVPIVVKTSNQEAADTYFSYHDFLMASYSDLSSLCSDIDCAERELGRVEGRFYPVAEGIIEDQSVKMVYTDYAEIQQLFSSKAKRRFKKVTSLRDALIFMVANGDANKLKGFETVPWEDPKSAASQPSASSSASQPSASSSASQPSASSSASQPSASRQDTENTSLLTTPQKQTVDSQIPPSPRTPSGKLRPKCKSCKKFMLGHDKAACDALKSRATSPSVHSSNTISLPSTISAPRSLSPPSEDEESNFIYGPPTFHSGNPKLLFTLLQNLPASRQTNAFVFEDIGEALRFQTEAQRLRFHSVLQVYSSPDASQVAPIFVVVGQSKPDVSSALQECLRPGSQITSALCSPAA